MTGLRYDLLVRQWTIYMTVVQCIERNFVVLCLIDILLDLSKND